MNVERLRLAQLHHQLTVVETVASDARRRPSVIRELDRLAEYLVGHTTPEAQGIKRRVQELIILVVPDRQHVTIYIEIYCGR